MEISKKILFIITQSELGGAQRFLLSLVSGLDKNKYDLKIAVGADGDEELINTLKTNGFSTTTLKNLKRNASIINDLKALSQIKKEILNFSPEVLFLLSSKAGFVGSLAAKQIRFKGKVIYRIGGWTFNDPWPKWKKIVYQIMEKVSAHWKDIIVVNNASDLHQAKMMGIKPRNSIISIYNGINPNKINFLLREEARKEIFRKLGINASEYERKNIVGTIANLYPAKGLEYLISSAKYFKNDPNTVFVVIGEGQERNKLEKLICDSTLEKKFFLAGRIANASRLLTAFDIFVLPSVKEGFPWSVLEAMSAKLPVIATRVGSIPEIIENDINGFIVSPQNPEEIAKYIQILSKDTLKASQMALNGHNTVTTRFDSIKMINQFEGLF